MRDPRTVRLVVVNAEDGLEAAFLAYLLEHYFGPRRGLLRRREHRGIIIVTEYGPGAQSVKLIGVGKRLLRTRRVVLSRENAHGVAQTAVFRLGRTLVWLIGFHGPHMATMRARYGARAESVQAGYFARLAEWWKRRRLAVGAGDGNQHVRETARILDATPHGEGVDGFMTSPGLVVVHEESDDTGREHGWNDHITYCIDIAIKETP